MNYFKGLIFMIGGIFFIFALGCGGGGGGSTSSPSITPPPTIGPTSPLLEPSNPIIENATVEQIAYDHNFPLNSGYNPPSLNGEYEMSGQVVASDISQTIGMAVNSTIFLSNQTADGRIDFREVIGNVTSGGAGTYYITGSNDTFTISARVITDTFGCIAENAIIISGHVLPNNNLEVETLSVNISKTNFSGFTVAEWHEIEGIMSYQTSDPLNTYYQDSDLDGFGNPAVSIESYSPPAGYVENDYDCDDSNPDINPDATEVCDFVDNNCDGQTDEGFNASCQLISFYQDSDLDGFGNPAISVVDYSQPAGYVLNDNDCDDIDSNVNPDAIELCDNLDNNCNGQIDEGFNSFCQKELNLIPTDDSYIDEEYSDVNYGNSTIIRTETLSIGYIKYGLLKFNIDAFLLDNPSNIIEAKLTITGITHANAGLANIWFYQIGGSDWDENTVNYSTRPMGQIRSIVLNNAEYNDIALEVDVSPFVEGWISGDENFGIKIQSYLLSGTSCIFYSKEAGEQAAATLKLIYE